MALFQEIIPVWMMHAYVDPAYDLQGGVFAMFNPSLPPVIDDPAEIEKLRPHRSPTHSTPRSTTRLLGDTVTVDAGQPIVFSNSDSVPHTVTAGSPAAAAAGQLRLGSARTGDSTS
ncbi:MAG: hypothetical protein R2695_12715 [Acidimicrobiales bacterium]